MTDGGPAFPQTQILNGQGQLEWPDEDHVDAALARWRETQQ